MTRYHDCSTKKKKIQLSICAELLAEASQEVCEKLILDKTDAVIRDRIEEMIVEKIGRLVKYNLAALITVADRDDITRPK